MKSLVLVAALLAAAFAALADPETYQLDPRHTIPAYEVTYWGLFVHRGRFDKASGTVAIDIAARKGSVDIVIDAASVSSGVDTFDDVLRGESYFNTGKFPRITLKGDAFVFDGDTLRSFTADFTMLGVTRPVTFNVTLFGCNPDPTTGRKTCRADVVGTIKRSEFGMKDAIPLVGDEVTLRIGVEAFRVDA